ncbi:ABC transporter ATP-binding protein [Actinobacteria bacterium YIM 96077]|uniref:ABC transporter ATP-binding protein n=1 Tax=Phytoactinopolyspora halophila TaxID=1981511 RepID=A0A329QN14_9ACTN|nr:ABC transporter ATP-binding protein [Phytoactinopolyspora halophila]AYY12338.1 ABC transporter ATP-binding protein [Actinobacteria bacterium YIM 96077]RAW13744.1 ABC transporter ATP-binding protein [Phytoactinopolyspora halophila]
MPDAIRCSNVTKHYGDIRAVDDVSFEVHDGEIFGMIGPNGAGKTTLMECIEGLRTRDTGTVEVFGMDPEREVRQVRERTGVQLQSAALPHRMKVGETLDLFAAFYQNPADWRQLLSRLGLDGKADSYVEKLSGGQRQRVFIALALINNPGLVFLDELTTGLDPQSRLAIWDVVRDIRDGGTTVFLTTHFMEEAENLCDRVAIVDHGKIVALDTVANLIASIDAESRITFTVDGTPPVDRLKEVSGVTRVENASGRVVVHGTGNRFQQDVMSVLSDIDLNVRDMRSEQPSLEDVFLALTGREMREGQPT